MNHDWRDYLGSIRGGLSDCQSTARVASTSSAYDQPLIDAERAGRSHTTRSATPR